MFGGRTGHNCRITVFGGAWVLGKGSSSSLIPPRLSAGSHHRHNPGIQVAEPPISEYQNPTDVQTGRLVERMLHNFAQVCANGVCKRGRSLYLGSHRDVLGQA